MRHAAPLLSTLVASAALACASAPADRAPGPHPPDPRLPPIPRVEGALDLRVSYPSNSAAIATRGRNFIFGSAGHADARVRINGEPVEVQPNGGFLAFLPVPEDSVYRLQATLGGRTQTLEVPIVPPPPPPAPADSARIVGGSITPAGAWVALPGERIEVAFTGTAGGEAWLALPDGERVPLTQSLAAGGGATVFEVTPGERRDDRAAAALATYRGSFTARRVLSPDTATRWPSLTGEPRPLTVPTEDGPARLVLVARGDTVVRALPLNLLLADPDRPRVGVGFDPDPPEQNGDDRIVARPGPGGGPYHYMWRNTVELALTGERNGIYRARLTDDLNAWTPAGDIVLRSSGTPPPSSRVATVRMDPQPGWIDVHVALDQRLPYRVEEGDRSISVLVYGATSRVNFLQHGRMDPYIERGEWSQPSDDLFRLDIHLAGMPWGYEVFWGEGGDLVLRIRRPPAIDPGAPFRGLTIGVDAGHGGAERSTMGPRGFTEADANLGIALALREALEDRGADVAMTRTADTTLSLVERTRFARERNVDLWISVHNNAFPDGVNPWENNGTSVYYLHPRAARLAWAVQRQLLAELGLRDLGVGRADLHQARFAWAPSILTENMFMMIPRQEAFLATARGQRRIAEAHVRGLEAWLRERLSRRQSKEH